MKRFLITAMLSLLFIFSSTGTFAQNIDRQPAWGPEGYEQASYYYLPDLNIYYDVANALFYYLSGGSWISNKHLPDKYKSSDLYSLYKVVINKEKNPWTNNKTHKKQYKDYKNDKTQTAIRYSSDSKYNNSKKNTGSWVDHQNRDNKSSKNGSNKNQKDNNRNGDKRK